MSNPQKIDFVVAWVDGGDPAWQLARARRMNPALLPDQIDVRETRYRSWDNLQYWFRAVEKYAPWVNQIHFVTWGHLPPWMNENAPKLHIVRHEDFIPREFLPVFSSHPIELNLHRISSLSEHFVYFNDDFFLTAPVKPEDFFHNGLPRDYLEETPIALSWHTPMNSVLANDIIFCSQQFGDRRAVRKRLRKKWFSPKDPKGMLKNILLSGLNDQSFFGLNIHHLPQAYRKQTLEAVWQADPALLAETCSHPFRDARDVSQCVFKFWQLLTGSFAPYNKNAFGKIYNPAYQLDAICDHITGRRAKTMCLLDSEKADFERCKAAINGAFRQVLPEKSRFEK